LQKIVQDIRKKDGSLLNKLRRLKSKPLPKVPARDYQDVEGDELRSEDEFDSDSFGDPHEDCDDNYEPPPTQRAFATTPSAPLSRGEYLDSCRDRPRKPLRPAKTTKPLPPEPTQMASDEEDYINPEADDDNYIDPTEKPSPSQSLPVMHSRLPPPTAPAKAHTADFKRPKIPLPQLLTPPSKYRPRMRLKAGHAERSRSPEKRMSATEKEVDVYRKPWYTSDCDRKIAEDAVIQSNKDGSFLVRRSSGQDPQQPYTLVVFYNARVYNIPIRFIHTTQQYALGKEKQGEERFSSVSHIIESHQRNPLVLIDTQSNTKDSTKLSYAVKP
ncbi:B-cell linker protein, partial [Diretmus argenteus]